MSEPTEPTESGVTMPTAPKELKNKEQNIMMEIRIAWLDYMKQLNIYLVHFPNFEKHALSSEIRTSSYFMFDYFVEIENKHNKKTSLNNLDIAYEKTRGKLWIAYKLGYFDFKNGTKSIHNDKKYIILNRMITDLEA